MAERYRLKIPTIAVRASDSGAVIMAAGSVLSIDPSTLEQDGLVPVECEGIVLAMFAIDLLKRCVKIDDNGESAHN